MKQLLLILVFCVPLHARLHTIKSERVFNKIIGRRSFVVALFYSLERSEQKSDMHCAIKELQLLMSSASMRNVYEQANVAFIAINGANKNTAPLLQEYDIRHTPVIMLFKEGQLVTDGTIPAMLKAVNCTRTELIAFIDQHLKKDMIAYLKFQQKERERRERNRALAAPYWYFGCGYPWYCAPGCGGCGFYF